MNAPLPFAALARGDDGAPPSASGDAGGAVQRTVWNAPYGTIVIEIIDGEVFVNGDHVAVIAPARPGAPP